ncbi:unnamed protein product [Diatraea saccharalis]|uniref:Uncharacterized protein n=1 Tax=Diatraea saccharalis TaxID=40085 RepID=A0A9N9WG45_9NEOP|nr:unnamed protein product [Diatraea saccharalis]
MEQCRLTFRKSRQGSGKSAMVLVCTPSLRKLLVGGGRLYVEWEVCRVADFTTAVCCGKCSLYGHNEKRYPQDNVIYSRCRKIGHKMEDCKVDTCHRRKGLPCSSTCRKMHGGKY